MTVAELPSRGKTSSCHVIAAARRPALAQYRGDEGQTGRS
ncbi:MAG: hypothetical protein AVDCRST_MAG29-219 [uncultured Nocardioidaceae bacterium]|uniref:Uncharacterized protein n=1 Tax=uncultured Nocardioidaceae bacterium TaxID=253824 RepID=A0A6J4KWZ0_9ACTN|nr:MAG: hypothetical protein AVDCRST_MAG29-219 [uncultured Nocardioidaceae bacterium]